jgi:hypothetical protein
MAHIPAGAEGADPARDRYALRAHAGRLPAWAVLEPVAAVLVLTAALSMIVHAPSLGTSFVVFYASGYLPFLFYATLQGMFSRL